MGFMAKRFYKSWERIAAEDAVAAEAQYEQQLFEDERLRVEYLRRWSPDSTQRTASNMEEEDVKWG